MRLLWRADSRGFLLCLGAPAEKPHSPERNAIGEKAEEAQLDSHQKRAWYHKTAVVLLVALLFFPAGFYWMWRYSGWSVAVKISVTVLLSLVILYCFLICFLNFPNRMGG